MKIEFADNVSEESFGSDDDSQISSDVNLGASLALEQEPRGGSNIIFVLQDGIQSGVPTLTTPTLTPTTLRNIEQTLIEWTTEPQASAPPYQAGFVPPLAPFQINDCGDTNSIASSESDSQSSWHTQAMHEENSMATTDNSSATMTGSPTFQNIGNNITGDLSTLSASTSSTPSRRNQGGRRAAKPSNLSPEEEEKRRVRRERNKLAAARCRKRRVDQTNELLDKVAVLEKEKDKFCKEIESLKLLKEDLEIRMDAHRPNCRHIGGLSVFSSNPKIAVNTSGRDSPLDVKPYIKDEPTDSLDSLDGPPSPKRIMLTHNNPLVAPLPNVSTISATLASASASFLNTPIITTSPPPTLSSALPSFGAKPNQPKPRPSSLNVPIQITPSQAIGLGKTVSTINGVPITTPSAGVMFNFDSLMQGGTGLTPVSGPLMPTCSSQNKHPLELTTPTSEPSKLVSL